MNISLKPYTPKSADSMDISLVTGKSTLTQIGSMRINTTNGIENLAIIKPIGTSQMFIQVDNQIGAYNLVAINHPKASSIRVSLEDNTIKAIAKTI